VKIYTVAGDETDRSSRESGVYTQCIRRWVASWAAQIIYSVDGRRCAGAGGRVVTRNTSLAIRSISSLPPSRRPFVGTHMSDCGGGGSGGVVRNVAFGHRSTTAAVAAAASPNLRRSFLPRTSAPEPISATII